MIKNYVVVLIEASNENLYNIYKNMFDRYISFQREVYELAFRKGWYTLEVSEDEKARNKYLTLDKEYSKLEI